MNINPSALLVGELLQKPSVARSEPAQPRPFDFGAFVNSLEGPKTDMDRLSLGILMDGQGTRELTIKEKVSCYQYQLERIAFEAAGGKGLFVSSRDAESFGQDKGFRSFGNALDIANHQGVTKARRKIRKKLK